MVDPLDNLASSEQLRRLLLQDEQERLDQLEARLGDDEALRSSLVPIIADVLREAGVQDHRRLAGSLAPLVLHSIKTEIHNSRDMMVDALYPITGRLVAAAVRNAFKDLVDQLNEKLDNSLSVDRWRARAKAKATGRSEAEILLSEGAAFEITDLLLINRQTGLLVARAGPDAEGGDVDSQLLGSILTAIMDFVRDAMGDSSEQDLRTLHVGDMRLHLQMSPAAILAVKTRGPPPAGFDSALNETFCAFLARWGDALSDPDQIESQQQMALGGDLEERFQALIEGKRSNFRKPSKKGTVLLASLALLAVAWIGWSLYGSWQKDRIETAARVVIGEQAELAGFPIQVRYRADADVLSVTGLAPDVQAHDRLSAALDRTIEETGLDMNVGVLPDRTVDLGGVATKEDLESWRTGLQADLTEVLDSKTTALAAAVARIEERLPSEAEQRLAAFRDWLDRQTLRFSDDDRFVDEAKTGDVLKETARKLAGLPEDVGLMVIGYADDFGDRETNAEVSRKRAEVVSRGLKSLGVDPDRLVAVGRANEARIGENDGTGSANRRVELELIHLADQPTAVDTDPTE